MEALEKSAKYDAIVVAGRLTTKEYDTAQIVSYASSAKSSSIIFSSTIDEKIRRKMRSDGCTHALKRSDEKHLIPELVNNLLSATK